MPRVLILCQTTSALPLILLISVLSIAIGVIGWLVLLRRRRKQDLASLIQGINRIAQGDLYHQVGLGNSGDLLPLADSINRMTRHLSQQTDLLRTRLQEQSIVHESMSSGLMALDRSQRVISINRAARRMLGLGDAEIDGLALRDVSVEPELKRFVADALQRESRLTREVELHGRQGAIVEAVAEPLRDGQDQPAGLLVLMNDLTRVRKLEAMRSDFAANVSHELRTPITNITGYVETLLDVGVSDPLQTTKFLDIIKRNADRLAAIIEDLLELARLEEPGREKTIERVPTPVRLIVDAAAVQFDAAIEEKNLTVRVDAAGDLTANVNARLIEQAISNLLSNAIKYSPPGSLIVIRAGQIADGMLEIAVIDQGAGIAPKHLPRLFERFYRVDKARSRQLGGTGLGLAIVKHIAQVHGGRAEVQSELGRGSTFRLLLPVTETFQLPLI